MPKPHADQYNLFGGVGAVTETQVAVAAGPECRFCDIGQEDCPDRVTVLEEELATAAGGHDLF